MQSKSPTSSVQLSQPCREFEFPEIQLATDNFDESLVIGHGGFGKVYKANLLHGSSLVKAAIKRLDSMSNQGASEFWAEVEILSKLRHCHLVSLFGYCHHGREMILIYEYMPNGTLDDHLHELGTPLSWLQRLKICIGAARGLDYLHTGTGIELGVIHRDVKTANILLHESWAAKISDFGLSRIGPTNQPSTYVNTLVKGTFGYLDPNYFTTGRLTRKSDVYAFGVVLLEVLCRKRAVDKSLDEDEWGLVPWAQDSIKQGKLKHIIDYDIRGEISPKCLKGFVRIVNKCLLSHPKQRPTMAEIVCSLESVLSLQEKNNSLMQAAGRTVFSRVLDIFSFTSNEENSPFYSSFLRKTSHENFDTRISKVGSKIRSSSEGVTLMSPNLKSFSFMELKNATRNFRTDGILGDGVFGCISKGISKVGRKIGSSSSEGVILTSPNLKSFSFMELKNATRNFRPDGILGVGGFGCIFKGWIDEFTLAASKPGSGMAIAVKKLKPESVQGHKEWLAEVTYLGQLHHPNLVKLIGYCLDDINRLLVYEFMPKGSLDNHLFRRGAQPLPWATRIKVAIGAARGLAFLHDAKDQVIFRDCKPSNILLDKEFNAKLSDFGLARAGPTDDRSHVSTRVMGTYGYAAPEYLVTGQLTARSDVYSYGVVLLELLSGRRVLDKNRVGIEQDLVKWTKPYLGDKRRLSKIMDPRLKRQYPQKGAYTVAKIALRCLSIKPKGRPKMSEVLANLEELQAAKDV